MRRTTMLFAAAGMIVASIGIVTWAWTRAHYPVRNAPLDGRRIVAFGDSLIVGVGASSGQDFVSALARLLGRPIVNAGVAGDTSGSALARLDEILQPPPDLVIVLLGGNDALQRLPVETTLANLEAIITNIQARGAAVLLLGVRGGAFGDPFRRAYAKLARRTKAAYVPNVLDGILGYPHLMADEIHPNGIGYQIMAQRVVVKLRELLR